MTWADDLLVSELRATLHPARPWRHDHPALPVRGALGAAMVHLLCVADDLACRPCPRRGTCLLPGWYDPGLVGSGLRPFWLRVRGGARVDPDHPLALTWRFLGEVPRASLVVEALARAAEVGLGDDRVRHEVELHEFGVAPLSALLPPPPPAATWTLRTASRLQLRGAAQAPIRRPTLEDVLRAGLRRVRELERAAGLPAGPAWPDPAPGGEPLHPAWIVADRWSARQGERVDLSGAEAAWSVPAATVEAHGALLRALTVLQVGRLTSAGLGAVELA